MFILENIRKLEETSPYSLAQIVEIVSKWWENFKKTKEGIEYINACSALDRFYNSVFNEWHQDMENDSTRLKTLQVLREWRQDMITKYYF
jgi:hypothetical protein